MSLTKVYDGQNMLVNQFSSKQEVIEVTIPIIIMLIIIKIIVIVVVNITTIDRLKIISKQLIINIIITVNIINMLDHQIVNQVVLASCFIPVFTGWVPPRYRGTRVIGHWQSNINNFEFFARNDQ